MDEFKYTLIVSQYYHSRHAFIVKHDSKTFLKKAKGFVAELEEYKRPDDLGREASFGDLTSRNDDVMRSRYNVNDYGDIYFLNSMYANHLMEEAIKYHEQSMRESKGYQKKAVLEHISNHHNQWRVKEILEKYFEIV